MTEHGYARRQAILRKYARPETGYAGRVLGKPMLCRPSPVAGERIARRRNGGQHKVIFDSREAAEACARELEEAIGGGPQRAYRCNFSKSGHYHLTRDTSQRSERERHAAGPECGSLPSGLRGRPRRDAS